MKKSDKCNNKKILTIVFQTLNENEIDYCVQNKYEQMPDEIPSDIDIMYRNTSERKLDNVVGEIAIKLMMIITQKVVHDYKQYTYVITPKSPEHSFRLQLDFYQALSFRKFSNAMPGKEMLCSKRFYKDLFYIPSSDVELVYLIMRRIIKHDLNNEHLYMAQKLKRINSDLCIANLKRTFGEKADILVEIIDTGNINKFEEYYKEFYNALLKICRKNSNIKFWIEYVKFIFVKILPQRILHPSGFSVAVIAPDGAGKSTLIAGLEDTCEGSFYGIKTYYFRPHLIKNIGSYNLFNPQFEQQINNAPHNVKPDGKFKSLIRFIFYQVDFILGWNMRIKIDLLRKKLVLFDRYYYDYYADMLRYRYSLSSNFAKRMSWMIPKPDLILVLDGKPEVFFKRKQEISIQEIKKQLDSFRELSGKYNNVKLVQADENIEYVLHSATKYILCTKAIKTLKCMKLDKNKRSIFRKILKDSLYS